MTKIGIGAAVAAAVLVGSVGLASAQTETVQVPMRKLQKGQAARDSRPLRTRTLTVAAPAAAPAPAPGITSPFGLVTAPIGAVGGLVAAPFNGLSQAFGGGSLAPRPLPIVARYADAGPVSDSVAEGWAQPVPVSANGPVYKLEGVSNNGGVFLPFALISAPISAVTTVAQAPFNAAGSILGAPPAPAPTF